MHIHGQLAPAPHAPPEPINYMVFAATMRIHSGLEARMLAACATNAHNLDAAHLVGRNWLRMRCWRRTRVFLYRWLCVSLPSQTSTVLVFAEKGRASCETANK